MTPSVCGAVHTRAPVSASTAYKVLIWPVARKTKPPATTGDGHTPLVVVVIAVFHTLVIVQLSKTLKASNPWIYAPVVVACGLPT